CRERGKERLRPSGRLCLARAPPFARTANRAHFVGRDRLSGPVNMPHHDPAPEFSRPLDVTRGPPQGSTGTALAEPPEDADLARRFGLPALHSLEAELEVAGWRGEGLKIKGRFTADLDQICVVSLDAFRSLLTDDFEGYFLPAGSSAGAALIENGDAQP